MRHPFAAIILIAVSACRGEQALTAASELPGRECIAPIAPSPATAPHTDGMNFLSGGSFRQGASALHSEEGPERVTTVNGFWIDQTEVTNSAYARFVEATGYVTLAERPLDPDRYPGLSADQLQPSSIVFVGNNDPNVSQNAWWQVVPGANWRHPEGPGSSIKGRENHPVVQIAFDDALAYARWLGRDLPTEAEWEYAARGGLDGKAYTWGDAPFDRKEPQANIWQGLFPVLDEGTDGYKARTAPAGCFPPNGYGLYDMAGNTWEWTKDWYRPNLDPAQTTNAAEPSQTDATPDSAGEMRHVIKGGSFLCADNYCLRYRPPAREAGPTDTGSSHVGFRTVLRESQSD